VLASCNRRSDDRLNVCQHNIATPDVGKEASSNQYCILLYLYYRDINQQGR
jgi:hypothetical protein